MDAVVLSGLTTKGSPDDTRTAIRNAKAAGLRTRALMMVGLPGTRPETADIETEFIERGEFDWLAVTVFTPIPGCDIAEHPAAYHCSIIPARANRSLCLYGPEGKSEILPTIRMDGMSDEELTAGMQRVVGAAEASGKLGKG